MRRTRLRAVGVRLLLMYLLVLAFALSACSVDVSGLTPAVTGGPPATERLIAPTWTAAPIPTLTVATLAANPALNSTPGIATPVAGPGQPQPTPFSIPVTWADRHLEGKLVFSAGTEGVLELDLVTGAVTSLFSTPDPINSWVVAAAIYSTTQQVIAYAPPPASGVIQFGYTELYKLPPDGSLPQPLFSQVPPKDSFFDPTWSPDGHWLYFVHLTTPMTQTDTSRFTIERMVYPSGQPAAVVPDAFWPRLSPDGQQLVFVHYDYQTGLQSLFVADADGSGQRQIPLPATFQSSDSPIFTPDEKSIVFSGINPVGVPALSWLDQLLGVRTAYADGSPADWWSVPVGGGTPKQLNHVSDSSMYGNFAPDGEHIAYISASGLFVMQPDGTDIIQLLRSVDLPGSVGSATVDWIK